MNESKKRRKKRIVYTVDQLIIEENVDNSSYDDDERKALKTFANRLNKELEEKNIDQEEFAKTIDISTGALSKYRNGKGFPQANTLYKMAKKFNCSTDYLLGLTTLRSPDENIKTVHKLTGLSDKAIAIMREQLELNDEAKESNTANTIFADGIKTINYLIENEQKYFLFKQLNEFLWFDTKHKEIVDKKVEVIDDATKLSYSMDMFTNLVKIQIDKTLYKLKEDIEV